MILGILGQQVGAGVGGAGGEADARYWRLYFTGLSGEVLELWSGDIVMAETIGGTNLVGAGTADASGVSSFFSRSDPASSFDGDIDTIWGSDGVLAAWISYDFGSGVLVDVNEITISTVGGTGPVANMFASALVQSSDDGSTWSTRWVIDPQTNWVAAEVRSFDSAVGLPALFVSDTQRQNQTSATTGTTFTGLHFGPERTDRLIAVSVISQRQTPITSMTIGGVAATRAERSKDATSSTALVEVWYARPTGESGDIVITHGGSETGFIRATAWNIGGVVDAVPTDTDRFDAGASGDMSITAPSGSVVIAVPCGGLSSVNLGGLDQTFIHNLTNSAFNGLAQEIVTTGATKTITATTTAARVAACWSI